MLEEIDISREENGQLSLCLWKVEDIYIYDLSEMVSKISLAQTIENGLRIYSLIWNFHYAAFSPVSRLKQCMLCYLFFPWCDKEGPPLGIIYAYNKTFQSGRRSL